MKKNLAVAAVFLVLCWLSPNSLASTIPSKTDSTIELTDIQVQEYLKSFRALPRKVKKERLQKAREIWKSSRSETRNAEENEIVILAILAVLLPPLAVVLKEKKVNKRFWICLLLSLLFLLPGIVYALLIVFGVIK